jgi:hypothetical protein
LSDDLTDLLVALGEAAQERRTGIAFLVDEVQFLKAFEFEALIAGLHRTVQRQLPITLVGAGLPQLPRLAGEAKSYAERLFKFPHIGELSPPEAEAALAQPASDLDVTFESGAIDVIVDYTEGYPYFIQEYGKIVWDIAPEGKPINEAVAREARRAVEAKLDESFFRVRAERTTELELRYLRAMAARPRGARCRSCRRTDGPHLRAAWTDAGQVDRQGADLHHWPRPRRIHSSTVRPVMRRNHELQPPRQNR